jgi:hypothetical protein
VEAQVVEALALRALMLLTALVMEQQAAQALHLLLRDLL